MNHLHIDIETFDTSITAVVPTIGYVVYDPDRPVGQHVFDSGVFRLGLAEQIVEGRTVSAATQKWWGEQSKEAKAALTVGASVSSRELPDIFKDIIGKHNIEAVWGNGVDFDNAIVNHLSKQFAGKAAIPYRMNRCYRTLLALFKHHLPEGFWETNNGCPHSAVADALAQAHGHTLIHQKLRALGVFQE